MARAHLLLASAGLAAFLGACGDSPPPKKTEPVLAPVAAPKPPVPEFKAEMKTMLESDTASARKDVEEGRDLRKRGMALRKSGDRAGGTELYNSALTKITGAANRMAKWCEPTTKLEITSDQRERYLSDLIKERETWILEAAELTTLIQLR
jgi:hypothetical protein